MRIPWFIPLLLGTVCGTPFPTASAAEPKDAAGSANYETWKREYGSRPTSYWFREGDSSRRLTVTAVEGDEQPRGRALEKYHIYGAQISGDWRAAWFSQTERGTKTGGVALITPAERSRLTELLKNLPDDGSRLPPAGRRVLVEVFDDGKPAVSRVYDRANAPEPLWEVVRLSTSGIRAWVPELEPGFTLKIGDHSHHGAFALLPDGRSFVTAGDHGPLTIWDTKTREAIKQAPRPIPVNGLTLSPDGSLAVVHFWGDCHVLETRGWGRLRDLSEPMIEGRGVLLSFPRFTPDGRWLMIQTSEPGLRIYQVGTWKRVEPPGWMPADATSYVPAARGDKAIAVRKGGDLVLWDAAGRKELATLDRGVEVTHAAFSPDGSTVSVATVRPDEERARRHQIRVWKVPKGELACELRAFEQRTLEAVEALLWSPDGGYVLAATSAHSFYTSRGIGVWNVSTGRHRGELTGCGQRIMGVALLPDGKTLVAGSGDGKVRFWDFKAVMQRVRELEASLGPAHR